MQVQVSTEQLAELEGHVKLLTELLTAAVYKRKGKKLIVTETDLKNILETGLSITKEENGDMVLAWSRNKEAK